MFHQSCLDTSGIWDIKAPLFVFHNNIQAITKRSWDRDDSLWRREFRISGKFKDSEIFIVCGDDKEVREQKGRELLIWGQ